VCVCSPSILINVAVTLSSDCRLGLGRVLIDYSLGFYDQM